MILGLHRHQLAMFAWHIYGLSSNMMALITSALFMWHTYGLSSSMMALITSKCGLIRGGTRWRGHLQAVPCLEDPEELEQRGLETANTAV